MKIKPIFLTMLAAGALSVGVTALAQDSAKPDSDANSAAGGQVPPADQGMNTDSGMKQDTGANQDTSRGISSDETTTTETTHKHKHKGKKKKSESSESGAAGSSGAAPAGGQ